MAFKYAVIVKTVWFTGFYYSIYPLGTVAIFFGLILLYWANKVFLNNFLI